MTTETNHPPHPFGSVSHFLASLTEGVQDPRVRFALECCDGLVGEPPLALGQIQEAIGVFRPRGRPCYRTIQRWVKSKGMPWSLDTSNNQRIYFLSKVLTWYQQAFPYVDVTEEAEERSRKTILRMAMGRSRLFPKVG